MIHWTDFHQILTVW